MREVQIPPPPFGNKEELKPSVLYLLERPLLLVQVVCLVRMIGYCFADRIQTAGYDTG